MSFTVQKPTTVPVRNAGAAQQPVEKLNMAMNLLGRVQGDPMQSAVRLGELVDLGLIKIGPGGMLLPGSDDQITVPGKNKLINGDFGIWQRGTSLPAATSLHYLADRWLTSSSGTTTATSRQTFAAGQTDVPGNSAFFHRVVVVSVAGAANYSAMEQRIEDVRTLSGQACTLSFYAKADAPKSIALDMYQSFGGGGSAVVGGVGAHKFALTTTWKKFTATVLLPSIAGKTIGSSHYLGLRFWFEAGSAYSAISSSLGQQSGTFDIAQVQLEQGSLATLFDARLIGDELALCQRYYEKSYNLDVVPGTGTEVGRVSNYHSSGVAGANIIHVPFRVRKRGSVAVTIYASTTGTAGNVCQDDGSTVGVTVDNAGESGFGANWTNSAGRVGAFFQWAADSEL